MQPIRREPTGPLPEIDLGRCTGHGSCVASCPEDVLRHTGGKAELHRPETCTYCGVCEDVCPNEAIHLPFVIVSAGRDAEDAALSRSRSDQPDQRPRATGGEA